MTYQDIPSRQKSQRLINKTKTSQQYQHFQQYKQRAKNITNINELLPGLNDISDAIEALPIDLIKYFTLLKEIDAKCIHNVPLINHYIKNYIDNLHGPEDGAAMDKPTKVKKLTTIRDKIHEIIPCLEEKMHVTSVASDLLNKHLFRIDNDYKLIINNNEIPESIRIGPLNHPAMIMDSSNPSDHTNPNRSAQSQRSESRREALAARKAHKDPEDETDDVMSGTNGANAAGLPGSKLKKTRKDATPAVESKPPAKKRSRKEVTTASKTQIMTPAPAVGPDVFTDDEPAKKRVAKPKKEHREEYTGAGGPMQATVAVNPNPPSGNSNEPTYCYCNQVSFGEMVGCDGDDCKREWFHLPCIGFKNPPKGKWYCDDCLTKMKVVKRV